MAAELDRILEPGERVLYRAPRTGWPLYSLFALSVLLGAALTALLIRALLIQNAAAAHLVLPSLLATAAWGLAFWLKKALIGRNLLVVTDRRVIRRRIWVDAAVTSISLGEIRSIMRLPEGRLEVRARSGEEITADSWERPVKLAAAIASAGGVAATDPPGPAAPSGKEKLAQAVLGLLVTAMLFAGFTALLLIPDDWINIVAAIGILWSGAALGLVWLAMLCVATALFGLATLVLARAFMSAAEVRQWLNRQLELKGKASRPFIGLLLRFAGLLYRRPMRPADPGREALPRRLRGMLEPGEQVLYRHRVDGPFWLMALLNLFAAMWLGCFMVFMMMLVAVTLREFSIPSALVIGGGLALLAPAFLAGVEDGPRGTMITDRRLLTTWGLGTGPIEIPLADIAAIETRFFPTIVDITRKNGRVAQIGLWRPQAFAARLADAAGLPRPPPIGRLEHMNEICFGLGGAICLALALILLPGTVVSRGTTGPIAALLTSVALVPPALVLGSHAARALMLFRLRRVVSAEQVATWLAMRFESEWSFQRLVLFRAPYYRLASLIWGRPIEPEGRGPEGRGG